MEVHFNFEKEAGTPVKYGDLLANECNEPGIVVEGGILLLKSPDTIVSYDNLAAIQDSISMGVWTKIPKGTTILLKQE